MGDTHGMGHIAHEENEPVFHEPWESRVFAITISYRHFRGESARSQGGASGQTVWRCVQLSRALQGSGASLHSQSQSEPRDPGDAQRHPPIFRNRIRRPAWSKFLILRRLPTRRGRTIHRSTAALGAGYVS
jgi:hypothetical protein